MNAYCCSFRLFRVSGCILVPLSSTILIMVVRGIVAAVLFHLYYFYSTYLLLFSLVDLVGRSLSLVTVPTEDYFEIVLTPAVVVFFSDTTTVLERAGSSDRGKGVAS